MGTWNQYLIIIISINTHYTLLVMPSLQLLPLWCFFGSSQLKSLVGVKDMLWLAYRPWNYIQANILKKLTWSIIWCSSALQGMGGKYIPKVWRYLARTTPNRACIGKRCLPILKRDSFDMYYVWYYFMSACSSDLQWDQKVNYKIYIYIYLSLW